jgi:nudix-type nucleoside diphosphatase (YffH/AdpP family)
MDPLQFSALRQLAQVATDGVFRSPEFLSEILGHDLALGSEATQDQFLTLCGQHRQYSFWRPWALAAGSTQRFLTDGLRLSKSPDTNIIARNCMIMHEVAMSRVRIVEERLLSDDWYVLKKTTFEYRCRDGRWERQSRETYDRGNGAVLLLFNVDRSTVVLIRQFRFPAFMNGCIDGLLVEACAGLLDGEDPHTCIRREAEEETGFRIRSPRKILEAYMSPGSVTEKLHFFVAEYELQDRVSAGGGDAAEGEDIEVLELTLASALQMIGTGAIQDGKTIMLLQYAALVGLDRLRDG